MHDELDSRSHQELSDIFAIEVANWSVMRAEAEHGDYWEMWHNDENRMVYPPKFADSLDEVVKFAGAGCMVIFRELDGWVVNIADVIVAKDSSLAAALCKALIRESRS